MNDKADDKQGFVNILKQKTNYQIAAAVLVLILIFSGSGSVQDKMQDAQRDHDHESALIIANKILKQDPNDSNAKAVIKQSGQLFYYLQQAKLTLSHYQTAGNVIIADPEQLSEGIKKARGFTVKAQQIDAKAERLLAFESALDQAENQLAHILAVSAMTSGQSVISEATSKYQVTSKIVKAAESSAYLNQLMTIQSSGAAIGKPVAEIKENIEPHLQQMQKSSEFVARTGAKDKSLTKELEAYISAVNATVDTMLSPQGNFKDFAKTADKSMAEYKKAFTQLKRKLSEYSSIEESIATLVDDLTGYKVFHDHDVYTIMSANKSLFE